MSKKESTRKGPAEYQSKTLTVEFADNLLCEVREIADAQGVSLYKQIRRFVSEGIRNFRRSHPYTIAPRREVAVDGAEWSPAR